MTDELLFFIRLAHLSLVVFAIELEHEVRVTPRNPEAVRRFRRRD